MLQPIQRKVSQWSQHPYVRFLMLLLLTMVMFVGALWTSGCDDCDESNTTYTTTTAETHSPTVSGPGTVQPGARVNLNVAPAPGAGSRSIIWEPPPGATDFSFSRQPLPGGPPFTFSDVSELSGVGVSYTAPSEETTLVDNFETWYSDGSAAAASINTQVTNGMGSASASGARTVAPLPMVPAGPQADVDMWESTKWVDSKGITLTTELCQEWLTRLQGDEFFLAARMPMTTTAITGSYRMPFVFGGPYSQTLHLQEYYPTYQSLLTATLEYRPERLNFLANELPSAEGEHWAALGISSTVPITCPEGLNVAMNEWGFRAELLLDLHDQPDTCEGCVVRYYYCYEGQESPLEFVAQQAAAAALARSWGLNSYQGEGITCLGPRVHHLVTWDSGLHLAGTEFAPITPTHPITLHEHVDNQTGGVVTLTVDYTSTVGGDWQLYGGTWTDPNLSDPITEATQIVLNNWQSHNIWLINDGVPTDTQGGSHSLVITATSVTSPSLYTWDEIPMWAGEWVPPPGGWRKVYLPLVLRSYP